MMLLGCKKKGAGFAERSAAAGDGGAPLMSLCSRQRREVSLGCGCRRLTHLSDHANTIHGKRCAVNSWNHLFSEALVDHRLPWRGPDSRSTKPITSATAR